MAEIDRGSVLDEVASLGSALVVVAHPDDESFGLGGVLAALTRSGVDVRVLCLTHGEASTLGATKDLAAVRRDELATAAERLGVSDVVLHDFPDGGLDAIDPAVLDGVVLDVLGSAATLIGFDADGVTGHPDHRAATAAALRVAMDQGLHVLEWGVSPAVAEVLNAELGTTFAGLTGDSASDIEVDRTVQLEAIACHESQSTDNPVLVRRLEISGPVDRIRLRRPGG
ncbi:PIG-L family deacetylase [Rhodococcus sp. ABRD24]|uniref:PIG-L deacetylase family protein n=1 Tax=Rhodococcus sp. ABRD24 TaxID=2507582 RepID=UPI0010393A61|nr:PIG-L deacetylase family protein [Rhodococcus sp. ABRD24]QBJ98336.1 PIG-L family deacetylase [Rhodococcus sp. ABRD24]